MTSDTLLDLDLDEPLTTPGTIKGYRWQELYPTLERKPLRLSYSTNNTIHSCARKFHLSKNKDTDEWDLPQESRINNTHLDFGSAMGIGTAEFLLTGDLDAAIWAALRSYNFAEETQTKNCLSLVTCLQSLASTWDQSKWEVAYYNSRPAVELSFKIILNEETQDYYCGYVDSILRHKETGLHVVLETKTTGLASDNIHPLYQNSSQGLGYSTVLDAIVPGNASWQVLYLIFQFPKRNIIPTLHVNPYTKTIQDRLEWLINLRYVYEQVCSYMDLGYWPKRESGCMFYGRACQYFGVCDLHALDDLEEARIMPEPEWDFVFSIEDLIERST